MHFCILDLPVKNPIYILNYATVTPLGIASFSSQKSFIRKRLDDFYAPLPSYVDDELQEIRKELKIYKSLDKATLLAIKTARLLQVSDKTTAINIGSSRGATHAWEDSHARFRESGTLKPQTSPLTTLGNISSWVAQDLGLRGVAFSHSITCATASHAILNALAWLESGMATTFMAGGVETPLTDFTLAQMKALKITVTEKVPFMCRALDITKEQNGMALGEAAALFVLSKNKTAQSQLAITGYGTAIEQITSATSVTETGDCLLHAMQHCLKNVPLDSIDAIVTHAPGTINGDRAEINAIKTLFKDKVPYLCNNKWQLGHSLGASGAVNLAMAAWMLETGSYPVIPYLDQEIPSHKPQRILINATGFGGNAVSLLLEKA